MKIAIVQLNPRIGDVEGNFQKIICFIEKSREAGADIVVFPELSLTGYPPKDLLLDSSFIEAVETKIKVLAAFTSGMMVVVGAPRKEDNKLFNSAVVFQEGLSKGFYDKCLLPNYDVFEEKQTTKINNAPVMFFQPKSATSNAGTTHDTFGCTKV